MATYKLAPVRWELGQILLPEHFSTLIAELTWHDRALEQGQLQIQSLTAVLPSGLLIHVPGSGTLEGLSLKATGVPKVKVYLHVLDEPASALGNPLYASEPKTVRRQVLSLRLSTTSVAGKTPSGVSGTAAG